MHSLALCGKSGSLQSLDKTRSFGRAAGREHVAQLGGLPRTRRRIDGAPKQVLRTQKLAGIATAEHQYHQTRGSTPLVDSISPASGVGGTSITIRGQRLSTTTAVLFDGLPATILSVPNDQTVHVIAPEHPGGTYPVVVQTGLGRAGRVVGAPTFEYTLLVDAVRQQDRVVPIWP